MRVLIEHVKQACDAVGLEYLTVAAGGRNGALERQAIQRMIIDDEYFVVHRSAGDWVMPPRHVAPAAGTRRVRLAALQAATVCGAGDSPRYARPELDRHRDRH